ncbi:3-(methylthio)propionyl-CoA ligase [Reyranella sp.]|uniref:3-(methylthio)propionyl-CoA ligase n=1 Tax=Reyranella sp. TaxID=1929291 RepID=UPI00121A61DB|nr:3-(methylthio)propionyl-CoA ligase [Reyranella sp.]TAJ82521.1 MAG: fatty-acid--CoA ligase [Reyranella sp.]
MFGLMQDRPLLISQLIEHAALNHGDTEIVSRTVEGPIHRYTYRDARLRAKKVAEALISLGIKPGDRIGTLAWNGYRHFELYYGISGMGAVCHTINPRLFPEQIVYIVNHAEDQLLFVDLNLLPAVEKLLPQMKGVRHVVAMTDRAHLPKDCNIPNLLVYEELIADKPGTYEWPEFDERTASSLCYTSGTTGNPKGVLYHHRSTVLHAYGSALPDTLGISARAVVLPVVPMFHVNAWGLPYSGPLVGAKLVFPGVALDGASLYELFEKEGVTFTAGVPTVWLALLNHMQANKLKLSTLKYAVIGGSAAPPAMIETFDKEFGVEVLHAWGMSEMSPLGSVNHPKAKHAKLPAKDMLTVRLKQGRPPFGVDMKIVDDAGKELPRDGKAFGDLLVRGPWITSGYFKGEGGEILDKDGWFATGDVATLDEDGYMQITDRSKDVIKSGGEWISSIDLENAAMAHPGVAEAAVIGVVHPKWDERPLLIVHRKPGIEIDKKELIEFLSSRVAKWWLPDDIQFVDAIPHTATGKILKTKLRETFKDYKLPTA